MPDESQLTIDYGNSDMSTFSDEKFPTATKPPNAWTTPAEAETDNGVSATSSSRGDQQGYGNFTMAIPAGVKVKGIEVEVKSRSSTGSGAILVSLSSSNGTSWTASQNVPLTGTMVPHTVGSPTDLWGKAGWSATDLSNAKFIVRIQNGVTGGTALVDYIQVKVTYASIASGLYATINLMMKEPADLPRTNLMSAVTAGTEELNNLDRHRPGKKKVLIMVSDGNANEPHIGPDSPAEASLKSADIAKLSPDVPVSVYAIHFGDPDGDPSGRNLLAQITTGDTIQFAGHQPGSVNDAGPSKDPAVIGTPSDSGTENGDGDHFFIALTSDQMLGFFTTIGQLECGVPIDSTPPPNLATLKVITRVHNDNGHLKQPGDFSMTVSATNVSKSSFPGQEDPPVEVTFTPGDYRVDEAYVGGYRKVIGADCSSHTAGPTSIVAGETRYCTIDNYDLPDVTPPPAPPPPPQTPISIDTWQENP